MLVSGFNLSQSFNYTPYLFYKKRFKSEINSFCIWTLGKKVPTYPISVVKPLALSMRSEEHSREKH
jgi:hypothetical protein